MTSTTTVTATWQATQRDGQTAALAALLFGPEPDDTPQDPQ